MNHSPGMDGVLFNHAEWEVMLDVFAECGPWSYLNCIDVVGSQTNSGLQGDAHLGLYPEGMAGM